MRCSALQPIELADFERRNGGFPTGRSWTEPIGLTELDWPFGLSHLGLPPRTAPQGTTLKNYPQELPRASPVVRSSSNRACRKSVRSVRRLGADGKRALKPWAGLSDLRRWDERKLAATLTSHPSFA